MQIGQYTSFFLDRQQNSLTFHDQINSLTFQISGNRVISLAVWHIQWSKVYALQTKSKELNIQKNDLHHQSTVWSAGCTADQ